MIVLPAETSFLDRIQLASVLTIRRLWADEALLPERAFALSDWVWRNLAPSPFAWAKSFSDPVHKFDSSEAFKRHLAMLLKPMHLNEERYEAFRNWVENEVLEPLLPANPGLIDGLAELIRTEIKYFSERFNEDQSSFDGSASL